MSVYATASFWDMAASTCVNIELWLPAAAFLRLRMSFQPKEKEAEDGA